MKDTDAIRWFRMSSPSTSSISICLWAKVCRGDEGLKSQRHCGNTDASNDHCAPHDGEDAVNIIMLEMFYIFGAGNVAEPEVFDHLVHGGTLVRVGPSPL